MMEFSFNEVGIDRMKLVCFDLQIVDLNKLYENAEILTSTVYKREFIVNDEIVELGTIFIKDPIFKLNVGIRKIKAYEEIPYQILEINPAKIIYGSNINNISDVEKFKLAIKMIEDRLKDYGLKVQLHNSIIEEIEINKNIKLKEHFSKYKNVFELIKSVLPKTLVKGASFDNREIAQYTGFKVENTQLSLKFYDKLVEQNINDNFSILRIEYKLMKRYKVNDILGLNTVNELNNNFNSIENGYNNLIEKHIIKKVYKKIKELKKFNLDNLIKCQKESRYYIKYLLAITQDELIFDSKLLEIAVSSLNIDKSSKSLRRKEIRNTLIEREKIGENLFFYNIDRMNEIIENLGFEKIII